ncbi:MAG: hypothetical protein V1663_02660 [archaeon]
MNGKKGALALEEIVGAEQLLTLNSDINPYLRNKLLQYLYNIKVDFRDRRIKKKEGGFLKNIVSYVTNYVSQLFSHKKCGAIVVLGYKQDHDACFYPMHTDLVEERGLEYNLRYQDAAEGLLMDAATGTDGAVLIDSDGNIAATGIYLNGFSLRDVVKTRDPNYVFKGRGSKTKRNLSQLFGFREKVGTRHINASAVSQILPDVLVYTLSEECPDPKIRIFYQGNIVASIYEDEVVNLNDPARYRLAA